MSGLLLKSCKYTFVLDTTKNKSPKNMWEKANNIHIFGMGKKVSKNTNENSTTSIFEKAIENITEKFSFY